MDDGHGFSEARRRLIAALWEGRYRHEARMALAEKNLLALGELGPEEVIRLLQRCRGDQHHASAHHADRNVVVHEFRPLVGGRSWYVKAYFRTSIAWIISVHESES